MCSQTRSGSCDQAALDRRGQQVSAESAAGELGQQSEVDDLGAAGTIAPQLEVAGGRAADGHQPQRHRRILPDTHGSRRRSTAGDRPSDTRGRPRCRGSARTMPGSRGPVRCERTDPAASRGCRAARSRISRYVRTAVIGISCAPARPSSAPPTRTSARAAVADSGVGDGPQLLRARRSDRRWRLPMLSALVSTMSRHGDAGLDASRVVSRRPRPASARPFGAGVAADDVHQRADGELGKMAEVREQPVVLFGVDELRNGAQFPARTRSASSARPPMPTGLASAATADRRRDPGARPRRRRRPRPRADGRR